MVSNFLEIFARDVCIEGDLKVTIEAINSTSHGLSYMQLVVKHNLNIFKEYNSVIFLGIFRCANLAAHCLAQFGKSVHEIEYYIESTFWFLKDTLSYRLVLKYTIAFFSFKKFKSLYLLVFLSRVDIDILFCLQKRNF